jgi:predicted nucleic acid-binding protein
MLYADTSVIVKLYIKEEFSEEVANWLRRNNEAIPLTLFHELEFTNAIKLKQFRTEISEDDALAILLRFHEHEKGGIYYRPTINLADTLMLAVDFSKRHTGNTGSRSLDILHVASALIIKADPFLTFDDKQSQLASVVGFTVEDLRRSSNF